MQLTQIPLNSVWMPYYFSIAVTDDASR